MLIQNLKKSQAQIILFRQVNFDECGFTEASHFCDRDNQLTSEERHTVNVVSTHMIDKQHFQSIERLMQDSVLNDSQSFCCNDSLSVKCCFKSTALIPFVYLLEKIRSTTNDSATLDEMESYTTALRNLLNKDSKCYFFFVFQLMCLQATQATVSVFGKKCYLNWSDNMFIISC